MGITEQVRQLKEYGACIDLKTKKEETALSLAVAHGHEETVQILLDKNVHSEDDKYLLKMARVFRAIELNDELLLQQLLNDDENKSLNGRDCSIFGNPFGPKALHLAISRGNRKIVALLLDNGADIEVEDEKGQRALHLAAMEAFNQETLQLLLEKGANIEAEDQEGRRALHYAAMDILTKETVQLLLEKGANTEAEDQEGRRALHYTAMETLNKETVQLLLEKGANIEAEDQEGRRALHYAAMETLNKETVQLLLEKGANIRTANNDGRRALHYAAFRGNAAVVRLLLKNGAMIDAKDEKGETALDVAVYYVNVAVVHLLLEKGAIPRTIYDEYDEQESKKLGFKKNWGAIQEVIDAWSEPVSDHS